MIDTATKKSLNYSLIDGGLSAIMGSLAGGIFLTGFAIRILNAQSAQIGVLASLPMFANLAQVFGSYIIEKTGKKKAMCVACVLASRLLWLFIVILPFGLFSNADSWKILILTVVIGLSSLFGSISGVAWLSWMSEIVPENIRGAYFGKRNMVSSALGMAAILSGGKFITFWSERFKEDNPFGFIILFTVGIAIGVVSAWFLNKIPETGNNSLRENTAPGIGYSILLAPFKDRNFVKLILFASAWIFSIQIAAPFYGVFMIENLNISFTTITVFGAFATLATLFMMKIWGPISDKLGNKPVIIVSGIALISVPFMWIIPSADNFFIPILIAHIVSGAFMAGAALSQFNIVIKLSPAYGRSSYFAVFAAITGLIGAVAPIAGGIMVKLLDNIQFGFFGYNITNLHVVFIVSAILQLLAFLFIVKIHEPRAAAPVEVILQLKNDLNPQAGISSGTDFALVEIRRAGSILRKIDDFTDNIADASHTRIGIAFDALAGALKKPISKLMEFFKS
jgi:MFS family permease